MERVVPTKVQWETSIKPSHPVYAKDIPDGIQSPWRFLNGDALGCRDRIFKLSSNLHHLSTRVLEGRIPC